MRKTNLGLIVLLMLVSVCACQASPTPLPATDVPQATATRASQRTPEPVYTVLPTASEVAPEATFKDVGAVAQLGGQHGVQGKAVVAGLQTLIILAFNFDGKGPQADVRLVKEENPAQAVHVLVRLEQRVYDQETLHLIIPSAVGPGTADSIAVFCPETGEVYALAKFD